MLKDNTMRYKLIIILFCFWTFDSWSQCCCGKFYFRIYDNKENKVYPAINDTLSMNINPNDIDIGTGKGVDNVKLPLSNLKIKSIKTEGNAGTSSLSIVKYPFTDLLFHFNTGCFTQLKKILVKRGKEKMILNLVNIPSETIILMDSIPFAEGEVTYNIEQIVRNNKECTYENLSGNKFYLHYHIPYNLIKMDLPLPLTEIKEVKTDSLYYYTDSLKTKILAKGKVKVRKYTVIYFNNSWQMKMNENLKRKEKHKIVTYLKRGTWTYNFENYSLQRKEKEKFERKIERKIYSKRR